MSIEIYILAINSRFLNKYYLKKYLDTTFIL